MKILTIDIGTGTQDIFLYDSRLDVENGYKLILPSPTMLVWKQISEATRAKVDVAISGVIMGGGPCGWAVEKHIQNGHRVYAAVEAAKTFDDDLDEVKSMGVILVSEDEIKSLPDTVIRIEARDFDFERIEKVFSLYGVSLDDLAAVAVGVFDHGNAHKDVSDRKFRFESLNRTLRETNRLSAFAYDATNIPTDLTRMQTVAKSAQSLPCPLMVMDTAPAAVLGAMLDPVFKVHERNLVVNIGNGHTLAFRLSPNGVEGVMEHHTGLLNAAKLDETLLDFAAGRLTNEKVYADHGHGALIYSQEPLPMDHEDFNFLVTGPRQNMATESRLKPHFAAPFGDMMLTGCFGLLSAAAEVYSELAEPILNSLAGKNSQHQAPWDLEL